MILSLFFIISLIMIGFYILVRKLWEKDVPFTFIIIGISIAISLICWGGVHLFHSEKATFKEIWNYKIIRVEYYEKWDEEVPCNHPIYETRVTTYTDVHTDSDGDSYTETHTTTEQVLIGYEHPYDVDYHPPYWQAIDEYEERHHINEKEYDKWRYIWCNNQIKDMHRDYHSIDGDMYYSVWNNQFNTIYPWETVKFYKNKIRVAKSVFNFAEVTEEISKKYKRPADSHNGNPIITYGISITEEDNLLFRRVNALFGKQYRIHNIIMLFDSSKYPTSEVENIKNAWKGPNKNELVTCISLSPIDNKILWCDVFSWMDDTTLHSLIRQDIMGIDTGTYNSEKVANILKNRIPTHWKKKDFRDFDYLKVDMPASYVIGGIIILVILNTILLVVSNVHYKENYE